jgi:phage terminase large subunit-like protein
LPPDGDWRAWLILAGRGFGKTRAGAEWVRAQIESGRCRRMILAARTVDDARDVMVEGESGILAICPPWNRPVWMPSTRMLKWPNGAIAMVYSADKPDLFRGKQCDGAWADELAAWRYPEAWDQLLLGLRLGADPRVVVTTTPRPTPVIKELMAHPTTVVTRGSTYDNRANLAPAFFDGIISRYEGTRLGRQELYAEILDDNPNALWQRAQIDKLRVKEAPQELQRVVVAIDPSVTTTGDEAGIIVAGLGPDGHGYVLEDATIRGSPHTWGSRAVQAYHRHQADRIVAEVNNGGEMVELTIRTVDDKVAYKAVHASRGKRTRAEPIAALYEQGRVHHVGTFAELEDEMCDWEPEMPSPNRMDALVWALTELMLGASYGVEYAPSLWG